MKRVIMMVAGLGLLAGMATAATAFPGGAPDEARMQQRMERMADSLGLTADQRQQVQQIHAQARPQFEEIGKRMQANRRAMHDLDPSAADYDAQVAKLAHEKGQLVEQMVIQRSHVRAQLHAVLTPEQQAKAKQLWQQRHQRKGDWHKGKGHKGQCPRDGRGPGMGPGAGV